MKDPYSENVIEFLTGQDQATVTFSREKFITRIEKLAQKFPDKCEIVAVNKDGSVCAHVPVSWVKINPSPQLSDEQREAKAQRARAVFNNTDDERRK